MGQSPDKTLTAYQLLQDVAARSLRYAQGLPSQVELKTYWSGIGFRLAGQNYVAPLGEVSEILTVPRYTRLPGVKNWVKGISNVRGRLLPVMDLGDFLGQPLTARKAQRRVLVVEQEEIYSGLVVDEVLGMQHFVSDSFEPQIEENIPASLQPFVSGEYRREQSWQVFSLYALAQHPEFMQVDV